MYLNDSKPHGGWFASSECLLQIGEKIGFKKCVLLDTLDMNFDIYSRTTDPGMKDLLNKSKIGLFKFSK
jgi:hypothetical protein